MPIARKLKATATSCASVSERGNGEEDNEFNVNPLTVSTSRPPSYQVRPPPRARREADFDPNFFPNKVNDEQVEKIIRTQRREVHIENFQCQGVTLENAPLHPKLLHNIHHVLKFKALLPLQEHCIEIFLHPNRPDLLVKSPTGSGKTAAFSIPAVQTALKYKSSIGPSVLIICNTQNLALQTRDNVRMLSGDVPCGLDAPPERTGVNVFGMYQGGNDDRRLSAENQPDIIVATMGILLRSLENKRLKLENLRLLIVDEADKMIKEGGFARETRQLMAAIPEESKKVLQVAAFSATFSDLEDQYGNLDMTNYSLKTIYYKNEKPVICVVEGVKGYITQRIIHLADINLHAPNDVMTNPAVRAEFTRQSVRNTLFSRKFGYLCALLDKDREQYLVNGVFTKTAVVFVGRITTSNFLATSLILKGYRVAPLNSNYDLVAVQEVLKKLINGEIQAVITTNKLARGQDISDLYHVIVYEMSDEFDDYKHRIGRTGRIGNGGISTALLSQQDSKHFCPLYWFLVEHRQKIPFWLFSYVEAVVAERSQYQEGECE